MDNESFGDEFEGVNMENVDKKFKCGNLVLLRNLDNEFVFDKEWVFRRKCSL